MSRLRAAWRTYCALPEPVRLALLIAVIIGTALVKPARAADAAPAPPVGPIIAMAPGQRVLCDNPAGCVTMTAEALQDLLQRVRAAADVMCRRSSL